MVAGLVLVAQGEERTEEPWTWVTRAAPPGSQTHRSKPTIRSDHLHLNTIRFYLMAPYHYTTDPQTLHTALQFSYYVFILFI